MTKTAVLLPYKERFSAIGGGAIMSVVRDQLLAIKPDKRPIVFGGVVDFPFNDLEFMPVHWQKSWWRSNSSQYLLAVSRILKQNAITHIEVHGRPKYISYLRRAFPQHKITLYLHNDLRVTPGFSSARARSNLIKKVDFLVTVSRFIRDRAVGDLPLDLQQKSIVALNGINIQDFSPGSSKAPMICFVGRMVREKGVHILLDALQNVLPGCPKWRVELIGATRFEHTAQLTPYQQQLRDKAAGLGEQVHFCGYLPREKVREKLAQAAIVVVPSLWQEPCSLAALEAMASGSCLVATARGGLPEVIGDAGILLRNQQDAALVTELASVLTMLLGAKEKRIEYQVKSRQRAVAELSIQKTVKKLETIR